MPRTATERTVEALAIAGYAGIATFLVLGFAAAAFPGLRAFLESREPVVSAALVLVFADLLVVWIAAVWMLSRERELPERIRTQWIFALALLCLFAGPAFVLWRRRREA